MDLQKYLELLGMKAKDCVTGAEGVITSISFDLYGCIQAVVTPGANADGKLESGRWFDVQRLKVTDKKSVMERPNFEHGPVALGKKGPAEKPAATN